MLSHTPPVLVSSYETTHKKRTRTGSLSGRLQRASELEERGLIGSEEKTILKDMIITGDDERLQTALDKYEGGDSAELEFLMAHGLLNKGASLDLLDDTMDLTCLHVGEGKDLDFSFPSSSKLSGELTLDEFDITFDMDGQPGSLGSIGGFGVGGHSVSPSMLTRTPPDPFTGSFEGLFSHSSKPASSKPAPSESNRGLTTPTSVHSRTSAIDIPGAKGRSQGQMLADIVDSGAAAERAERRVEYNEDGTEKKRFIGAYSPEARRRRIHRFLEKRKRRVWTKKVKYDVRKNFADSRMRVKGRFVKKEDEELLRDLLSIT